MTPEESKKLNGLKKTVTIVVLIVSCLGLLGTLGGAFMMIGAAQEKIARLEAAEKEKVSQKEFDALQKNLESAIVGLVSTQANLALNVYAIAVKVKATDIIKPE